MVEECRPIASAKVSRLRFAGSSGLVGMREKWVLVLRDSYQQLAKNRCQYKSQDGDGYGRENGPKKEGVPLPQPDAAS